MQCFPFVEENDGILFGDATVYYAGMYVCMYVWVCTILYEYTWIIHPCTRSMHQGGGKYLSILGRTTQTWKFSSSFAIRSVGWSRTIATATSCMLTRSSRRNCPLTIWSTWLWMSARAAWWKCSISSSEGNSNATLTSSQLEAMVARYLKGFRSKDFKHYQRAASIVSHSLYYPAIYHWIKVFGPSNIKVVAMEWFSPASLPLQYKLSKIQSLGLLGSDFFDRWDKKNRKKKVDQYFLKLIYSDIYRWVTCRPNLSKEFSSPL